MSFKRTMSLLLVLCMLVSLFPTSAFATEVEEPHTHVWNEGAVTTPATCTAEGVKTFTCTGCGETTTEPIAAAGHTLTAHEAVAATCTAAGNSAYWECTACGKYFSDAEGKTEIAADNVVIPALEHNFENGVCTRDGCGVAQITGTGADPTGGVPGTPGNPVPDIPFPATHTVTFYANNGSGATSTQSFDSAALTLDANTFSRAGYTFLYWTVNQDGTGTQYADRAELTLDEAADFALYAQWTVAYPEAEVTSAANNDAVEVRPFEQVLDTSATPYGTVTPEKVYTFTAKDTAEQASAGDFADWRCDYVVSMDQATPANSIGLFGAYGAWQEGTRIAFLSPVNAGAGEMIPLLGSMGGNNFWSYSNIASMVGTFACGAFNLSRENIGKTLTVRLVIWDENDPVYQSYQTAKVVEEIKYRFTEANFTPIYKDGKAYEYVGSGASDENFGLPGFAAVVATIGDTSYSSVQEAVGAVDEGASFTVTEQTTIGSVSVPAGSTVTVEESETVEGVTAKEVSITSGETTNTAYVVTSGESTAVFTGVEVTKNDSFTAEAGKTAEDYVDVAKLLATAVANNVVSVTDSNSAAMTLSLSKTEATAADANGNETLEAVIAAAAADENKAVFEVHPVITFAGSDYDASDFTTAGAEFTFTLNLGSGFAGKLVKLTHYDDDGTVKETFTKTANANGVVEVTLSSFSLLGAEPGSPVAKVGNTEYETIEEAVTAWGPGKTLTLLADVEYNQTVTVEVNADISGQNWILELGDYTWTALGCNAFKVFASGEKEINSNYGLKIYANQDGGITATGKYCIDCTYNDPSTRYRPRLEIHGGTYTGSEIIYYNRSAWNNSKITNGLSVYLYTGATDGKEPIFNGNFGLFKCRIEIHAGFFNGTDFNTYPITSTADTWVYGGHFKNQTALPSNSNSKNTKFQSVVVYVDGEGTYHAQTPPTVYNARTSRTTHKFFTNYSSSIYWADANMAISNFSSLNEKKVILSADVTATENTSVSSGTYTIDTTAEGASYTGTVTLNGTSAKFVLIGQRATADQVVKGTSSTLSSYYLVESVSGNTYTYSLSQTRVAEINGYSYTTLDNVAAAYPDGVSTGTFYVDPATVKCADGYGFAKTGESEWVVGVLTETAPTQSAENPDEYTITKTVKDGTTEDVLANQTITVEIVGAEQGEDSAAATTPAQVIAAKVIDKALDAATVPVSGDVAVEIELVVKAASENEWPSVIEHPEGAQLVEAYPEAIVTVNGTQMPDPVPLENGDLTPGATFTFGLPVTFADGTPVTVSHYSTEGALKGSFNALVSGGKVPVTVSSFSYFTIEQITQTEGMTVVNLGPGANGGTQYATLTAAISNATAGDTIALLDSFTEGDIEVTKTVTVDLNGKTLTIDPDANAAFVVNGKSKTLIINNGTISSDVDNTAGIQLTGNGSALVLNDVAVTLTGAGSNGVELKGNSSTSFTINSGSVSAVSAAVKGSEGIAYLNGGSLSANSAVALTAGSVTVSGATLTGAEDGIHNNDATAEITVTSGSVTATAGTAIITMGKLTVSGGTISGTVAINNIDQKQTIISNGTIIGKLDSNDRYSNSRIAASGGTFTVDPGVYAATGYISWHSDDTHWTVYPAINVKFVDDPDEQTFAVANGKTFNEAVTEKGYTLDDPVKTNYVFDGWFVDVTDSTTQFDPADPVTADVTYTAKWTPAKATVTHNGVVTPYKTLQEALAAAVDNDTVTLLGDIDMSSAVTGNDRYPISKSVTIDGGGHTITIGGRGFGVGKDASSPIDVTFQNVTINNSSSGARCIDTRGNIGTLTLDHVTLKTDGASGYTQPLTIGGNQADIATVNITNSTIQTNNAGTAYYAIITFNPVNMTIDHSTIKGWACIYAKGPDDSAGSDGSVFTITNSELVSKNIYSGTTNGFSMFMVEDDNVTFNVTDTEISITNTGNQDQSIVSFQAGEVKTGVEVNLGAGNEVTFTNTGSGTTSFATSSAPVAVSGGTFNVPVPDEVCATGYVPTEDLVHSTYGVTPAWIVRFVVHDGAAYTEYASINVKKSPVQAIMATQKPADPTREGYTFVEWREQGASVGFNFATEVRNDINLVAYFTKDITIAVSGVDGWIAGNEPDTPVVTGNTGNATVTLTYEQKGEGDSWTALAGAPTVATPAGTYRVTASVPATDAGVDPTENNVIGYSAATSAPVEFIVGDAVASLTHDGVTTNYTSFEAAVAAAVSNDTVTLLHETTITTLANIEGKTGLVINLGGNKINWKAPDVHINQGSSVTIQNGTIDITGAVSNADCIIGVGWYNNSANTLTLDEVTLTGDGYSSAYAVIYAYGNGVNTLNLTDCIVTLKGEQASEGGAFKGGSVANNKITVTNSRLTLDNISRGFTSCDVTVNNSVVAIANSDNGFNGSAVTIDNSTVSVTNGSGRGITAGSAPVVIKGSSTVTLSGNAEGDLRLDANSSVSVEDTATLAPTVVKENGKAAEAALTVAATAIAPHALVSTATPGTYDAKADLAAAFEAVNTDGKTVKLIANDSAETVAVNNSATLNVGAFNVTGQITVADGKTLTIEGAADNANSGVFANYPSKTGSGKLAIKGGYFPSKVAVADCAEGYTPVNSETSGKGWTVATTVARTADNVTYPTLAEALAAVSKDNALAWVSDEIWPVETPVYYNGVFYQAGNGRGALENAMEAANTANESAAALIYVRPNFNQTDAKELVKQAHQNIKTSMTIYGNNAHLNLAWEPTVEYSGTGYHELTKNVVNSIYNLHDGAGFWGARTTEYAVTLNMANCYNVHEVLLNGGTTSTGANTYNIENCTFIPVANGGYTTIPTIGSMYPTTMNVSGCTFTGLSGNYVINLNNKMGGTSSLTISDCEFDTCGGTSVKGIIRANGESANATVSLTADKLTFTNSVATSLCDIQIGHADEASDNKATVSYSVSNTTGVLKVFEKDSTTLKNINATNIVAGTDYIGNNTPTVAQVGSVKYETLAEALTYVPTDGTTVTLVNDVTETDTVTVPDTMTLITGTYSVVPQINVADNEILTVEGTGTFTNTPALGEGSALVLKGGTYPTDVNQYCDTGLYAERNGNGTYTVKDGTAVARLNGQYYTSLQAAVDAIGVGTDANHYASGTIYLLKDIELTGPVYIPSSNVTSDSWSTYLDVTIDGSNTVGATADNSNGHFTISGLYSDSFNVFFTGNGQPLRHNTSLTVNNVNFKNTNPAPANNRVKGFVATTEGTGVPTNDLHLTFTGCTFTNFYTPVYFSEGTDAQSFAGRSLAITNCKYTDVLFGYVVETYQDGSYALATQVAVSYSPDSSARPVAEREFWEVAQVGNRVYTTIAAASAAAVLPETNAEVTILRTPTTAEAAAYTLPYGEVLTIKGNVGDFVVNPAEGYAPTSLSKVTTGEGTAQTTTYSYLTPVAQVNGIKYPTVQQAVEAANTTTATVALLPATGGATITESITVAAGQTITLELNGNTMSGGTNNSNAAITNNGTLTIQDSSNPSTGTVKRDDTNPVGSYYVIDNAGTLTIASGSFTNASGAANGHSGSSLIRTQKGATTNIQGGTLTQDRFNVLKDEGGCTVNITGGTITCTDAEYAILTYGNLSISGNPEITGPVDIRGYKDNTEDVHGTATITGGTFNSVFYVEQYTGYNSTVNPSLSISGGTFNNVAFHVGEGKDSNSFTANATKGSIAVSGGSFSSQVPLEYCASGYVPSGADTQGMYTVKEGTAVCYIEDSTTHVKTYYATLPGALTAAAPGDTITLLADVNLGSSSLNIAKAITLTSDAGKTFTITSSAAAAVEISGTGDVTIDNVNITATNGCGVQIGKTAHYSGVASIKDSVITVAKRGINVLDVDAGFKLNVVGSTIQSNVADPTTAYTTGEDSRGINLSSDPLAYEVKLTDTTIGGFSYDFNVYSGSANVTVNMTGGATYGRAAINNWGDNNTFNLTGVDINGLNNQTGPTESFACIVDNEGAENNTYNINSCTFTATLSDAAMSVSGSSATEYMTALRGYGAKVNYTGAVTYTSNGGPKRSGLDECLAVSDDSGFTEISMDAAAYTSLTDYVDALPEHIATEDTSHGYLISKAAALVIDSDTLVVTKYETLAGAVAAAHALSTEESVPSVVLLKDAVISDTLVITKSVDIDLAGYDITANDTRAIWVKSGEVTITGEGTISASGNGLNATSSVIRVGSSGSDKAKLTIDENVTVSSDKSYVVTVFGSNTNGVELVVNGTVSSTVPAGTEADAAISGNGNSGNKGAVTINAGASVNGGNVTAIYHPQNDSLTINGGTITGATAVYVKCGTVNITAGTLNGTGAAADYSYNGNGCNATGDALVVDNCNYPGGVSSVTVSGGSFISTHGKGIGSYHGNTATELAPVIAKNTTSIINGQIWVTNDDPATAAAYPYKLVEAKDVAASVTHGENVTYYVTLAEAVAAAAETGDTITLLNDVALTSTQVINKSFTLDLNGKNITATDARALWVKSGDVSIVDNSTGETKGTISATHGEGSFASSSSVIRVGDSAANANAAKLTVGENVTVSSDYCYGVTVFGVNDTDNNKTTSDIELVVNGTVSVTGEQAAVSGNGTNTLSATTMTIGSTGKVTAANDYAIYHPGKGTLTVSGTVEGKGGIEVKSGTVTINDGAKVTATATAQSHSTNNNGTSTSGYAIAAVNNAGYVGDPAVTISGGTVTGKTVIIADGDMLNGATVTKTGGTADAADGFTWGATSNRLLKQVTVTADSGKTKVYGETDPALTATVDGVETGDSLTYTVTRDEGENVGTYTITPSGAAEQGNYYVTYETRTFTITKAAATVTADAKSKIYGDAEPTLTATITGLKNNDAESVITYTLSRVTGENAGTYTITPSGAAEQGNYDVTYKTGTFTINKAALTVTAADKSKVYGDADPALTWNVEGLQNNDTKDVLTDVTISREAGKEDPGEYTITVTGSADLTNYTVTYVTGKFVIEGAVYVSLYAVGGSFTEGGSFRKFKFAVNSDRAEGDLPVPTRSGKVFRGWIDNDTGETWSRTTGKYEKDYTLFADWDTQYVVKFYNDSVLFAEQDVSVGHPATRPTEPTKEGYTFGGWFKAGTEFDFATPITESVELHAKWLAHITVKADDANKVQGEADPVFTASCAALDDGYTVTATVTRSTGEAVGTYTLTPSNAVIKHTVGETETDVTADYVIAYETGAFTINQAAARIGDTYYATLEAAMAAAQNGDTVKLLRNWTLDEPMNLTLAEGSSVTLDLGGKTLSGRTNLKSGSLTLRNGTVAGGDQQALNVYGSSDASAENYSVLTIASDVTVTADQFGVCLFGKTYNSNGYGAVVNIAGTVHTAGNGAEGAVFVSGNLGNNVSSDAHNVINITGTVTSETDAAVALNGLATVNVTDGAAITGNTAIAVKRGTLNVTGGTVHATGAKNYPGTPNYNGTEMTGAAISVTETYNQYGALGVNITGGTVTSDNADALYKREATYQNDANYAVSGGSFSTVVPEAFCAPDYVPVTTADANGMYHVTEAVYVAKINDKGYTSLTAAVAAVQDGETITLLADSPTANATNGKAFTIAMNGHKLTGVTWVTNNTNLTIDGSEAGSTYQGSVYVGYATDNNGSVTLDGGTYSCGSGNTVLHINGTCMSSDVTIKNAKISSPDDNGIQLNGSGTFVIENSEISGATGVYVKSGELTITNSKIIGTMNPANYSYYGNGANATGDAIVIDSCKYPGGAPKVTLGEGNTFAATKNQIGYYEYAPAGQTPDKGDVEATSNTLSVPEGYAWFAKDGGYELAKAWTVSFDLNGGTGTAGADYSEQLVADGKTAAAVAAPDKADAVFSGWTYQDGSEEKTFAFATPIAQNYALTAKWTEAVAAIGDTLYTSLDAAITAAQNGETVKLLKDIDLTATQNITDSLTLDLNGHSITAAGTRALYVKSGEVSLVDSSTGTTKGVVRSTHTDGDGFDKDSSVIRVGSSGDAKAKLTIGAGVTVEAPYSYGVTVFGTNTQGVELVVNGTVTASGLNGAISGNGNSGNKGAVTVNVGAVISSATDAAIYHPQNDSLTINGGTITGPTAVYVKCGTVSITGGTLNGNGAAADYSFNGNGCNATGDALVVDNCSYPGGVSSVTVSGGSFNSANGKGIGSYYGNTATELAPVVAESNSITVPDTEMWVDTGNAQNPYKLVEAVIVSFDTNGGTPAVIASQKIAKGSTATAPEAPTSARPFVGWFIDGADTAFDFTTAVNESITLKAKWDEAKVAVTVTSSGNGTIYGDSVMTLSGGGAYAVGETVTLVATTTEGYSFLGWYDKTGAKLSGSLTYSYTVRSENNDLIAVYNPSSADKTFHLTVTGSKFTVTGYSATQRSRLDADIEVNKGLTVKFVDTNVNFLYWINGSNKVVSRNPEYSFSLVQDTVLTAVYSESATNEALVVFLSAETNGQVMSSGYFTSTDTIQMPNAPYNMGMTFQYWTLDGINEATSVVLSNAIASADKGRVEVYPYYTQDGDTYDVTVHYIVNGSEAGTNAVTGVAVGTPTSVKAEATYDGASFAYWSDKAADGEILSYNVKYSVRPTRSIDLYAVYASETVEAEPTIVMTNAFATLNGAKYRVSFTTTRSVPDSYTVTELGILYARESNLEIDKPDKVLSDMVLNSENGNVKKLLSSSTARNGTHTGSINTADPDRVFYARGYLAAKDAEGEIHIYYTDIVSGCYHSLASQNDGGNNG